MSKVLKICQFSLMNSYHLFSISGDKTPNWAQCVFGSSLSLVTVL